MRLPVNTVIHTTLVGLEPATFRSLVRRATSSATEPTKVGVAVSSVTTLLQIFHRKVCGLISLGHIYVRLKSLLTSRIITLSVQLWFRFDIYIVLIFVV